MELIERKAIKRRFENYRMDCEEAGDTVAEKVFADCIAELEVVPTIDAAPVVHGHWVRNGEGLLDCSRCGCCYAVPYDYCPSCGARMDGGEGHEAD